MQNISNLILCLLTSLQNFPATITHSIKYLQNFHFTPDHVSIIVILSISLLMLAFGSISVYDTSFNWILYKFDDSENLNVAYNLAHGKGLTSDLIDLSANTEEENISELSRYDEISHTFGGKGPIYYTLLAGWLNITQATYDNWYNWGSTFNFILMSFFVIAFYFFTKKYFGQEIAIISTFTVSTMPIVFWFATRIRPEIPIYIFMIFTMYFLLKDKGRKYVILAAITATLAHLTHPIGFGIVIAGIFYLIYKRKIKSLLIFGITWILAMSPWFFRNYSTFGDPLWTTAIPIPRTILDKIGLMNKDAPLYEIGAKGLESGPSSITVGGFSPSETILGMLSEINVIYAFEIFIIIMIFSIFAFVSLKSYKKNSVSPTKNYPKEIILIFGTIGFFQFLMIGQLTDRALQDVRFILPYLFLFVPLGVLGIKKIIERFSYKIPTKNKNRFSIGIPSIIFGILIIIQLYSGVTELEIFYTDWKETKLHTELNDWIILNTDRHANVASDLPHIVVLKTDRNSVNYLWIYKDDPNYAEWIIKKFDIDYLAFYYGPTPLTTLNDGISLEHMYKASLGDKEAHIYKIIREN